MKKNNSVPTMKDVAAEAGVALGTVSKVVNGLPVGDSYRIRVEDAIKKLNYQVNSYAQGLKADKTHTIALLIPNTVQPFYASLVYHINLSLLKRKYRMLLCSTDYDTSLEQEYITMAQQNKVDGIIGLTYNPNLIIEESTPFVAIDRSMGPKIPCVASDNFAGGQLAAEKLADLGCKNVAFLRTGSSLTNEPNKRKAGFENGCLSRSLKYEMKILNDGEPFEEFEKFLMEHIYNGKLSFDGIFCVTDSLAFSIIQILQKLGQKIPEDVQIIGFDGVRHFGNKNYVCSTIVQPVSEMAEMCVELLLQENMPTRPPLVCLPVTYAYGGTTSETAGALT
ncbi:LacI family DNA-binding transcriptional regulator [Lachnospiraceae bacterium]|jgi:LacI family transcriptional regulator|nr:LacI family DNA-binding transcriptional regulator [Lachnospiraceae bacterium]